MSVYIVPNQFFIDSIQFIAHTNPISKSPLNGNI